MEKMKVDLLATPSHSFFDGAGIMRGLSDLSQEGTIRLRVTDSPICDPKHRAITFVEARRNASTRKIAIDFADRSDYFSSVFLDKVDTYYKRSFFREAISRLPPSHQSKIKPYGLNIACLGYGATFPHMSTSARLFVTRLRGPHRLPFGSAVSEFAGNALMLHGIPGPKAFEATKALQDSSTIILQTRIWPPEPSTDSLETVNSERIALARALKSAFGSNFIGGIVDDQFARANCPPDLLVRQNKRRSAYVNLLRTSGIGIYVRGLHGAIAIKMAEYMAAGLCIVSEPIKFELPAPLIEGVHYLEYRNHEECVAHCQWLHARPEERARMRAANLDYYRKWAEPKAHAHDLLLRAWEA